MGEQEVVQENNFSEQDNFHKIIAMPEMVLDWKKHYLKEGHSVHSATTYYNYIRRFVGYGIKVNQKTVDKFRENNMSGACSGALKNFFKFLVHKKDFPRELLYIYFDKSKSTKKFPKSITPLEVTKIIEAMPSLMEKNLTLMTFELGLRISETLKLTWGDFSWTAWLQDRSKYGSVNLLNTKGGKFRTIPVHPYIMEKLYNDHKNRTAEGLPIGGLLFDFGIKNYIDPKKSKEENQYNYIVLHAEDRYRKLLYRVSKEVLNKLVNPHMLRHSKGQDMMNNNVPIETIKAYLGHGSLTSTEIYAKASPEKIRADLEKYYGKDD
jgi:integrase